MKEERRPPAGKCHYALLVNRAASRYQRRPVEALIAAIRSRRGAYTLYKPSTPTETLHQAEVALGRRRATLACPRPYVRGGKVTALVACGGDGTFNLVARAALRADIPVGCLPLGRFNNIARSLNPTVEPDKAIEKIISRGYRTIDTATAAGLPFFGSVGLGFVVKMLEQLQKQDVPRLSFGWSQLGARAASEVRLKRTILKVDAFRFEIRPIILSINLLSYSAGLPLTPASIPDDGLAEVVFDQGNNAGSFSAFTRLTLRKKYLYGDDVRLYRGRAITCQSVKGSTLYLDGELIELPDDTLEVRISDKKLHVFS